jgi:prophage regulatory protein
MVKLVRAKEIADAKSVSVSTVWRWVQAGILPKPVRLTQRTTVWNADEVDAALEKRAAELGVGAE